MSERASHYSEKSSSHLRKTNKSQMEKCRRARINDCLNELKALVLEAMKRDTSRYSKLEKADILEMTVKHLRTVQRQQMAAAVSQDPTVVNRYRAGFNECAQEVTRYLGSIDGVNSEVKCRVMGHLSNIVQNANPTPPVQKTAQAINHRPIQIQIPQMLAPAVMNNFGQVTCQMPKTMVSQQTVAILQSPQSLIESPVDHQFQTIDGTIQVVPSHLTTGQFAYIIPTNVSDGSTDTKLASHVIPLYSSKITDGPLLNARVNANVQTPLLVQTSFIQPASDFTSPMCATDAPALNPQLPGQRIPSVSRSVVPSVSQIVPNSTNVAVSRDNAPTDDFMWRPW